MKNTTHPNFIFGIISIILVLIGIGFKANSYPLGNYILIGSTFLGAIHWIWAIIDVSGRPEEDLKAFQKRFWLIAVIAVPALGALVLVFCEFWILTIISWICNADSAPTNSVS